MCTDIIDVNIITKKVQDDNKNVRVANAWKNLIKNVRLDQPFVSKKEQRNVPEMKDESLAKL